MKKKEQHTFLKTTFGKNYHELLSYLLDNERYDRKTIASIAKAARKKLNMKIAKGMGLSYSKAMMTEFMKKFKLSHNENWYKSFQITLIRLDKFVEQGDESHMRMDGQGVLFVINKTIIDESPAKEAWYHIANKFTDAYDICILSNEPPKLGEYYIDIEMIESERRPKKFTRFNKSKPEHVKKWYRKILATSDADLSDEIGAAKIKSDFLMVFTTSYNREYPMREMEILCDSSGFPILTNKKYLITRPYGNPNIKLRRVRAARRKIR